MNGFLPDNKILRVAIIAGELSGDKLGAGLIKEVLSHNKQVCFEGVAGPNMQAAGCKALYAAEELAVMGLTEVIKDLPRLLSIKKSLLTHWEKNPPDLFIGIDAPDFNLRIAASLKTQGIKTVQYVCPSVWAWRQGRVKKIVKAVDELYCLLPFEPQYFSDTSVTAHYVGHPLADSIPLSNKEVNENVSVETAYQIAVLPGSRQSEVARLLPPFIATIVQLEKKYANASFLIPAANPSLLTIIQTYLSAQQLTHLPITLQLGQAEEVLNKADVALIASGTVALEAMLHACPMVVAYKLAPSTYYMLRWTKAFKAKYFSLPNILADKPLVQEVLQEGVNPDRLSRNISYWLDNTKARQSLINEFKVMHSTLRQNTNQTVAKLVSNSLMNHLQTQDNH